MPLPTFQPPQVIFTPPAAGSTDTDGGHDGERESGGRRRGVRGKGGADGETAERRGQAADEPAEAGAGQAAEDEADTEREPDGRRRRRRSGRSRGRDGAEAEQAEAGEAEAGAEPAEQAEAAEAGVEEEGGTSRRRRRRRRRGAGEAEQATPDDPPNTVVHIRVPRKTAEEGGADEVQSVRGSTRLEAKRQRRREGRESGRRRPPIITESEFLARREAVDRLMVVRQQGERTQIGVLEDGVLVEHYVDKSSHQSLVGNVYLGKVQNVLPSMEAAFVDIGKGRNAVLYAGEVNFDASGLEGESKRIESALKSGQSVLVQVTKDPVGHKGARLTSQVSLPGRYLVYVPGGSMMGISRKLPDKERTRLKQILKQVMPEGAGVIVRTAAEGAAEDELAHDVARLSAQWESIEQKAKTASAPELLYSEPDLTIRVVRDIFNEDFSTLVVDGGDAWDLVEEYVRYVAPNLAERLSHWQDGVDVFSHYRIDEQLAKALDRKVWLPSGGSLVIDKTEAMTVIDVNTGKFTGQGGNLEQTVTRNNLEAAEEIVRQLRLRDVGGIIVIDFIDMVLESNRELVLRRLLECLARDRTKHQVAEVTSLGLVQMTRKRVGSGLLEAFSQPCECCNGRGVLVSMDLEEAAPAGHRGRGGGREDGRQGRDGRRGKNGRGDRDAAAKEAAGKDTAGKDSAVKEAAGKEAAGKEAAGSRAGKEAAGSRAGKAGAGKAGAGGDGAGKEGAGAESAETGTAARDAAGRDAAGGGAGQEPAAQEGGPAAGGTEHAGAPAGQPAAGEARAGGQPREGDGAGRSRGRRRAATREQAPPAPAYQALADANGAGLPGSASQAPAGQAGTTSAAAGSSDAASQGAASTGAASTGAVSTGWASPQATGTAPAAPTGTQPADAGPAASTSAETAPAEAAPRASVPGEAAPGASAQAEAAQAEAAPGVGVPGESASAEAAPGVSGPAEAAPAEAAPAETAPADADPADAGPAEPAAPGGRPAGTEWAGTEPAGAGWQGTMFGGAGDGLGVSPAATGAGGTAGFGLPAGPASPGGSGGFAAPLGWAEANGGEPGSPGGPGEDTLPSAPHQPALDETVPGGAAADRGHDTDPDDGNASGPPPAG